MSAAAIVRSLHPAARRAPVLPWRVYPKIVLQQCAWCSGRGSYTTHRDGHPVQFRCSQCAGHGTLTVEGTLA